MNFIKLYYDFLNTLEIMSDEEAGKFIKVLLRYAATGDVDTETIDTQLRFVFMMEKTRIDRDKEYCEALTLKRSEAGKMGGRPKKDTEPTESKQKQKKQVLFDESKKSKKSNNNNYNYNDNDNYNDNNNYNSNDDAEPVLFFIPLINGDTHNVRQSDLKHWQELYPAVDVEQEIRNMIGWCEGNPANRKTPNGVKRFINGWLQKAQNNARRTATEPKTVETAFGRMPVLTHVPANGEEWLGW